MDKSSILFNEGVRTRYYLNTPNRRGWSVIYMLIQIGNKRLRISTMIKVKTDYWKKGNISVPLYATMTDRYVHSYINEKLNNINNLVDNLLKSYLCTCSEINADYVFEEIVKLINKNKIMNTNSKILTQLFEGLVLEMSNEKSQRSLRGIIGNFRTFLKENKIPNNIESLTMATMRSYREWLANSSLSASRCKQCLSYTFTLITKLERKYGYDFKLNKTQIEPIKEKRTTQEKRKNAIVLTHDEIDKLLALKLDDKNRIFRDLFVIQCYTGVRFEDLKLLLCRENMTEHNGIVFSVFATQKKKILSHIPLNSNKLYPTTLDLVTKHLDSEVNDSAYYAKKYNKAIKEVAKAANLDRIIERSQTIKGKVEKKNVPIFQILSSHSGRHTFITNSQRYKGLTPSQIIAISGHSDTSMVEKVYTNLEVTDTLNMLSNIGNDDTTTKIKKIFDDLSKNHPEEKLKLIGDSQSIEVTNKAFETTFVNDINEAKKVLNFLGEDVDNYIHINDIGLLIAMIGRKESKVMEKLGIDNTITIKEIFNSYADPKEQKNALHKLYEMTR